MCLQYRPTVVACFCIYLACKWSRWEIPQSTEGKHWFYYVDKTVSLDLLKQLTDEFIAIYEKSPARLKSKLNSIKAIAQGASNRTANSKDKPKEDWKITEMMKGYHSNITTPPELLNGNDSRDRDRDRERERERERDPSSLLPPPAMVPQQRRQDGGHQRSSSVSGVPGSSSSSSSSSHKMPNYPGGMPPEAHPGKYFNNCKKNHIFNIFVLKITSQSSRAITIECPQVTSVVVAVDSVPREVAASAAAHPRRLQASSLADRLCPWTITNPLAACRR